MGKIENHLMLETNRLLNDGEFWREIDNWMCVCVAKYGVGEKKLRRYGAGEIDSDTFVSNRWREYS